jgi:hypothetical protein
MKQQGIRFRSDEQELTSGASEIFVHLKREEAAWITGGLRKFMQRSRD